MIHEVGGVLKSLEYSFAIEPAVRAPVLPSEADGRNEVAGHVAAIEIKDRA